jgi:hypothetical protein
MPYRMFKALVGTLFLCTIFSSVFSDAECPIDMVIVIGQVEHAPRKGIVKVQLVYPKGKIGESGDTTIEDASFRIQIPFLTQSRAPFLNGSIPRGKCARKPETIVVSLTEDDQEYDRISLKIDKDFKKVDPSAFALRSEILLHGQSGETRTH